MSTGKSSETVTVTFLILDCALLLILYVDVQMQPIRSASVSYTWPLHETSNLLVPNCLLSCFTSVLTFVLLAHAPLATTLTLAAHQFMGTVAWRAGRQVRYNKCAQQIGMQAQFGAHSRRVK